MSSSSDLNSLRFATRQINLYGELFVFIIGIIGELLNIVVFSTLKTFRQTTCSFYLIINAIANIGILIVILLRVIYDGFNGGLTYTSLFCKFRYLLARYWILLSMTSMCLVSIDQFISMTSYRHWSNLKIARRLIAFAGVLWLITSIFDFIYYGEYLDECVVTNAIYAKYNTYFYSSFVVEFLPLIVMIVFSLLAFFKTRTITSRQINITRLSRDRQLTAMALFHVLFIAIFNTPFVIYFTYTLTITTKDPIQIAHNQLIYTILILFYYISFSVSFLLDKPKSLVCLF